MSNGYREWKAQLKEENKDYPYPYLLPYSSSTGYQHWSKKEMHMKNYKKWKKNNHRKFKEHKKELRWDVSGDPIYWRKHNKFEEFTYNFHYWQFTTHFDKGRKHHGVG